LNELSVDSVRKSACKVAFKVVAHFGFELDIAVYVESRARADSDKIDVRARSREVQIISENTDFNVIAIVGTALRG